VYLLYNLPEDNTIMHSEIQESHSRCRANRLCI